MCGVIGIAHRNRHVAPLIVDSLKRLEYRGYDSVGVATLYNGTIFIGKDKGKIDEVDAKLNLKWLPGFIGIGHTRWATHGPPSRENAHPHVDCKGIIALAHNGIIENFLELRDCLSRGHFFSSETDTEVISHLVEELFKDEGDIVVAFRKAMTMIKGTYAIVALSPLLPDGLLCARDGSPLLVGLDDDATYCASDVTAFLPFTNRGIILEDDCMAVARKGELLAERVSDGTIVKPKVIEIPWTIEMACKGGYPHHMIKEIHEQPQALRETLTVNMRELDEAVKVISEANHVYLTGAGTSNHAAVAGKYMMARLASKMMHPVLSSEFYEVLQDLLSNDSAVIAITQSGETADTLEAAKYAKSKGAKVLAITNVVGSSVTRIADAVLYTRAGPEVGVAATKTFLSQLALLALLALRLGELNNALGDVELERMKQKIYEVPSLVSEAIRLTEEKAKLLAKKYSSRRSFFFLGRGINVATAMEGALKLKEISYVHAEAYPAGESKHGPIALVRKGFPVVFVAPPDETKSKIVGNIMEMKARGANIISLTQEGEKEVEQLSDDVFILPATPAPLTPITYTVPLQLFAYYMAVERGADPDKPRNLAKSVTVH
ncbi:MAG: glutamine--fructose-6-phosphate transaminase (isomerizing) [Candidatus Freyarchaeota archaeon]|nr:glutamine--fructose-6-phosphate transaminase (isomerizing) [Candidatus Jordarchaeia archaeon]